MLKSTVKSFAVMFFMAGQSLAGPYTEPGISGYVDRMGRVAKPAEPNAVINPVFRGWATGITSYQPSDSQWSGGAWSDPQKALGPATGSNFDIVSLGELDPNEISQGKTPGQITLAFGDPNAPNAPNALNSPNRAIRNGKGYDFAVFENGFASLSTTPAGSVSGQMLAELAYVEVSSNGVNFVRFPSVSLTNGRVGPYGTIEISNVYNLAGKHPNSYNTCTGTGFDLDDIADNPLVAAGTVDINNIRFIRIVDIPGSGDFFDNASRYADPNTFPEWDFYSAEHPVFDAWITWGSGGFDLEAVGVLNEQKYSADINLDGVVDLTDFAMFASAWQSHFGMQNFSARCDFSQSRNLAVDVYDLMVLAEQWFAREDWAIRQ